MGTQHGNLHPAGWPVLLCGPTQKPCVSHNQHRKNWERFWKKCRWMKGRNKQGRNPWQYTQHVWLYTDLLQALKGERLRSVFSSDGTLNFCVRVSPLRGRIKKNEETKSERNNEKKLMINERKTKKSDALSLQSRRHLQGRRTRVIPGRIARRKWIHILGATAKLLNPADASSEASISRDWPGTTTRHFL